jgi:hypothetical protein
MKKIIIAFIAILFFTEIYSQTEEPTVLASSRLKHSKTFNFNPVIFKQLGNKDVVLIQKDKQKFEITKFDEKLNKLNDRIEFEFEKNQSYFFPYDIEIGEGIKLDILTSKGKVLVAIEEKNKKTTKVFVKELNLVTGKYESENKPLLESSNLVGASVKFAIDNSGNKKIILYYTTSVEGKTKDKDRNFAVFNASYELEYKIKLNNINEENLEFFKYEFIDNKIVVIVGHSQVQTGKFLLRSPSNKIKIQAYIYTEKGILDKEYIVENVKESYIGTFKTAKVGNSLKFVTSYSDTEKGIIKGFASFSVDVDEKSTPQLKYHEIGEDVMCQYAMFESEKKSIIASYKSKKNKTKYNYFIKRIIKHDNGYFAVIQQEGAKTLNGKIIQHKEIWYRDFIIASYDLNDNLNWIKKAPVISLQIILSDWGWDAIVKDGDLILVHPHLQNKFHDNPDKPGKKASKGDFLVMQKLDKEGNLSRKIIYDLKKELKLAQFTSYASSNNKNSISFLGYTRGQYHIVRVDFGD